MLNTIEIKKILENIKYKKKTKRDYYFIQIYSLITFKTIFRRLSKELNVKSKRENVNSKGIHVV